MPAKTGRRYIACPRCVGSWVYADRLHAFPLCNRCWKAWPQAAGQAAGAEVGEDAPKGRKSRSRARKVRWTRDEWETWPENVPAPPGLSKAQSKPASGKPAIDAEVVQALLAGADEATKALLERVGVRAPEPAQAGLEELCRKNIALMPEDIQAVLAEEGPQPTPAQTATAAGKALKEAAVSLRAAVGTKVALQARLDKAKQAYQSLLEDMASINTQIEDRQKDVLQCQSALKDSAASVPEPSPLEDILNLISGAGVTLTDDQRARIQAATSVPPTRPEAQSEGGAPGVRMPINPRVSASQLPAQAQADIIRDLRNDLVHTQAALVRTTQELQRSQEAATTALAEPAAKKLKADPPPGDDQGKPEGTGQAEGSRSRSPKNRSKPMGDEAGQTT